MLNSIKKLFSSPVFEPSSTVKNLYTKFEKSLSPTYFDRNVKLKENEVWSEIQKLEKSERELLALTAFQKLIDPNDSEYNYRVIRRKVFKTEFNQKNPPSKESLIIVFQLCRGLEYHSSHHLPINDIMFCFKHFKEYYGEDEHYLKAKKAIIKLHKESYYDGQLKKIVIGLKKLDMAEQENALCFDTKDQLGLHLKERWEQYDETMKKAIHHCWGIDQKSKPTKSWTKEAKSIASNMSNSHYEYLSDIFSLLIQSGTSVVKRINDSISMENYDQKSNCYLRDNNEVAVSYLVWLAVYTNDEQLNSLIGELALISYKKITWTGPLSTKNGNACMYAFTIMPPKVGITQMLNIRNKTQNKNIKNTADRNIKRKAEEMGISEDALLELSVPTFNLVDGKCIIDIGNYAGIIHVEDIKNVKVEWQNLETEKFQKSMPKDVKENFKTELKSFKSKVKDIETAVNVQIRRLENSYLNNLEWSVEDWISNYKQHPFLSLFTDKLIWSFDDKLSAMVDGDSLLNANHEKQNISQFKKVKLWHPLYSEASEVNTWREYMIDNEIVQPFKQAFREIYIVTDAELHTDTYSNRFAAHILYQHQFLALAKSRDWQYHLQGGFDSHNTPTRSIQAFDMRAEYWVEPVEDSLNDVGIFSYVASDQVRFYNSREIVRMQEVPKIVFSEIMRDVDLYVGVTSIGNNPEWQDTGEQRDYWHNYSFGALSETAKTRKLVFEKILPKLKIANKCKLTDKFLIVDGSIRTYKIHLGSGNILMSPNDQYLCIVPNSRSGNSNIFLPFDNDRTLSIILSKAFLLYDDDKIKDTTITSQIKF